MANAFRLPDLSDTRPRTLLECLDEEGDVCWKKRMDYRARMDEEKARFFESLIGDEDEDEEESIAPRPRRVRTAKKIQFVTHKEQGEQVPMTPLNSPWYLLYVVSRSFIKNFACVSF
jgi:hypothetical protein